MFGTKRPSITSTWTQSHPALSIASTYDEIIRIVGNGLDTQQVCVSTTLVGVSFDSSTLDMAVSILGFFSHYYKKSTYLFSESGKVCRQNGRSDLHDMATSRHVREILMQIICRDADWRTIISSLEHLSTLLVAKTLTPQARREVLVVGAGAALRVFVIALCMVIVVYWISDYNEIIRIQDAAVVRIVPSKYIVHRLILSSRVRGNAWSFMMHGEISVICDRTIPGIHLSSIHTYTCIFNGCGDHIMCS